jgi:hypothetical protein
MQHLRRAWAALGVEKGNERFQHLYLPEDPVEAHLALVHLVQGRTASLTARTASTEPTEYDHGRLHDLVANGGFSHHPEYGSAPSEGYMASYHAPEGSGVAQVHHLSEIGPEHIAAHREAVSKHLSQPDSYQGGWLDRSEDKVYLDASRHFKHEPEVRKFAVDQKQKAYFNLKDFSETYLHPKLDPDAMKDEGAWKQKYAHLPEHERENPPEGYSSFAHLYPATEDQKKHWGDKGEHLANKMEGRPVGPWRDEQWVTDQLHQRQ